jgi:response regulator RpfG family c-di-GMP phosphodiesterase
MLRPPLAQPIHSVTLPSTMETPPASNRILLVDDDQNLLDALVRTHRRNHQLVAACGAAAGLEKLRNNGPFAVVVSDQRMPGMDGVTFLRKVQELAPDTVRVMLTGNSDLETAVAAVNQGAVFRFLRKPCPEEVFAAGLNVALRQHQLQQAEKQLLEQTLRGSIQVLTDVLMLANPTAFGRARRVHHYVGQIAEQLQLSPRWEFETAALLSQLGCVAVPGDVLTRAAAGEKLLPAERQVFDRHPATAAELLGHIPRLEGVARAIACQRCRLDGAGASHAHDAAEGVPMAARVLAVALDFEELVHGGTPPEKAVAELRGRGGRYDPRCLAALDRL